MGFLDGGFLGWTRKPAPKAPAAKAAAKSPATAPASQFQASQSASSMDGNSPHAMRKDLLRMVLRETLTRNGIPLQWIGADLLKATTVRGKEPGVHVRLLIRHWDPRLLVHGVAFEQNFYKRVVAMDPLAVNWMMGISWQYALDDMDMCPQLPHPGSWTSMPAAEAAAVAGAAMPAGDVIAGPVNVGDKVADLEKMLAERDEQLRRSGGDDFAATQPFPPT